MGFYQAQKIEKLEARIAELEKDQRDNADVLLIAHMDGYNTAKEECRARIAALEAQVAELEAKLYAATPWSGKDD